MPRISRQNRPKRPLAAESLEPRQVLAVAVVAALPDLVIPVNSPTLNQTISLAGRYNDTAVAGTVVPVIEAGKWMVRKNQAMGKGRSAQGDQG